MLYDAYRYYYIMDDPTSFSSILCETMELRAEILDKILCFGVLKVSVGHLCLLVCKGAHAADGGGGHGAGQTTPRTGRYTGRHAPGLPAGRHWQELLHLLLIVTVTYTFNFIISAEI